MMAQGVRHGRY